MEGSQSVTPNFPAPDPGRGKGGAAGSADDACSARPAQVRPQPGTSTLLRVQGSGFRVQGSGFRANPERYPQTRNASGGGVGPARPAQVRPQPGAALWREESPGDSFSTFTM